MRLRLLLEFVAMYLQSTVKNPQSLATEFDILDEIRDLINQIHPQSPPASPSQSNTP